MKRKSNSATWMSEAAEQDGAKIEWLNSNTFIAKKNNVELIFLETRCLDTHSASGLARHKGHAKNLLLRNGAPVPPGRVCKDIYEAKIFFDESSAPVVVKPVIGTKGRGISVNIESHAELETACIRAGIEKNPILIEEMVSGLEYRVMVLGGKPIAALYKDPANITGDGKSTIEILIKKKNRTRRLNPNLAIYKIKVDEYILGNLSKQNLTLESVLPAGKKIYLRKEGNLSAGGESIDVTDDLPESVFEACVKAAGSFPGMELAGVDIFYDEQKQSCHILEVNTNPGCGGHLFPYKGRARNVTSLIWKYSYQQALAKANAREKFAYK
ncbi:hypothetical protein ACT3UG_01335 [Halomonas sp. AOP27-A1-34]|uniref:hypothetical protein n=1 Tax=Halomonas sp. AOP27-A1-34 TaxID=3457708 RepID=UPI004033D89D